METEHTESERPRVRRGGRTVAAVAAVAALFGSGLGIGYLFTPGTTVTEAAPTTLVDTTTTSSTTTLAVHPAGVSTDPPLSGPTDEPIADVAQLLLPSIVQIEFDTGIGSGVIYDANGLILTAAHVVDVANGADPTIRLYNGDRLTATVVGADTANDIAVIRVDRTGLPAAALALDQAPRVGQMAVAIGSPWGLDSTVTAGIVSAMRSLETTDGSLTYRSMIQTDASINPGNSGGALADRSGRVMGINVSIFTSSGASDGVGFAVPIDRAYRVAQALVEGRQFVPGFLGVRGGGAEVGQEAGAVIVEVTPGTAAESAGLEVNDLVVAVDGSPVTGIEDLAARVRDREAGEQITLTVIRDGERVEIPVTLGSQ